MPDTDIQIELERNDAAAAEVGLDVDVEGEAEIGVALLQMDAPPLDPADAILAEVRERDLRLEKLRTAAIKSRKEQTAAFLELLTRVEQLCADIPERGEQIAVMTRDWRMSRADTLRLLRLRNLPEEARAFYTKACVTPEMIVALHKSTDVIREEAHLLIGAGRVLHTTDLARMRKRREAINPVARRAMQGRKVRALLTRVGVDQLSAYKLRLQRMVRLLAKGYLMDCDRHERRAEFLRTAAMSSASLLLAEFDALFPIDLPEIKDLDDWYEVVPDDCAGHLAKARIGLKRMSEGDFLLSDFYYNDWGPINLTLVQALAWLADTDVSHLPTEWPGGADRDETMQNEREEYRRLDEPCHLTSLEICSGAGGAAIGLHAAGFEFVGLVERNKFAVRTLMANNVLGPIFHEDVQHMDFERYKGKIDLFAGGVPCQPHSTLGRQAGAEDERDLFMRALDIIREVRPRAVILENVVGFGQRQAHAYRARIFADLFEAGYDAELFAIRASDYGLAQARPRLVLVAMRDGLMGRFKMPPVLSAEPVTLGEALRDLMAENGWPGADAWADRANESGPTLVGGSEKSGNQGFSSGLQLEDWEARHIDARKIAIAAPGKDAADNHIPALTLRMGVRLQGFPDRWVFQGTPREQRRQIANAFPPIMACVVALAVREALTGKPANYDLELLQHRISAVGSLNGTNSAAYQKAKELGLPCGIADEMSAFDLGAALIPGFVRSENLEGMRKFEPLLEMWDIRLVKRYCKASRPKRARMDISELPEGTRRVLMAMDKKAFKALSQAEDWAIRHFIDEKAHGIEGVSDIKMPRKRGDDGFIVRKAIVSEKLGQ